MNKLLLIAALIFTSATVTSVQAEPLGWYIVITVCEGCEPAPMMHIYSTEVLCNNALIKNIHSMRKQALKAGDSWYFIDIECIEFLGLLRYLKRYKLI